MLTFDHSPAFGAAAALAAATLLALSGCGGKGGDGGEATPPEPEYARFSAEIMSTVVEVMLPADERAAALADSVFALFRDVDASMSEWKESSPLSEVNRKAGDGGWVAVPADLLAVIEKGIAVGEATDGAFDITWAALWGLWDFRAAEPSVPAADEIARRAALVDFRAVGIDSAAGAIRLARRGMKMGLGGIAKGYALDRSAAALRRLGRSSFLLSAGGQIYAAGRKGERRWRVGIRDPRGAPDDFFALFEAENVSVSTSGDYERFFVSDGVRYHHILDPRSGTPSRGLRSATVVAADATTADAFSTALMVLGRDRGLDLIEATPGAEAVVVDSAGSLYSTSGARDGLIVRHEPTKR